MKPEYTITIDFDSRGDPTIWTQASDKLTPKQKEKYGSLVKEIKQALTPKQLTLIKSTYGERPGDSMVLERLE